MTNKAYALAREELVRVLTAYTGITTANGLDNGTTLIDANLIGKDSQKIVEKTILIMSGDAEWEDKGASAFNTDTGQITLQGTGFSAQIVAGTIFRILNISSIEIDVANIDTKIGTNVDAAGTTTLFAWLAKLLEQGGQGLVYYGLVTTYTDTTHFRVSGLTGFGDDYFANNYRVYVVWDAGGAGAAPQGEMQPCSDYDSADGIFAHTVFTAPLAVGDKVLLIHERLAEVADILADTSELQTDWADGGRLDLLIDAIKAVTDAIPDAGALTALIADITAILADTGELQTDWADGGRLDLLIDAIEAKLDVQKGTIGIFYEQADAAINESVDNTEHFVVALTTGNTRYILRNLRLKSEDPGAGNTITVKLYELINSGEVNVDSFVITQANFTTYFSLMDMFGLPHIAGDSIRVSLTGALAGPKTVTGQYSHGKTNV